MAERRVGFNGDRGALENDAMRHVGLRLPDELFDRLKSLAEADRRPLNTYLTILIERHVADAERQAREADQGQ
jgi:predicted DNA-binding protein